MSTRQLSLHGLVALLGCALTAGAWSQGQVPATAPQGDPKEAPIREAAARFEQIYNAHDAQGVANLFLPEAQIVHADDETTQGRAAIQELFAAVFAESPETTIDVEVESISFLGTALAVERGVTTTVSAPGAPAEQSRYLVLHVLRDGHWEMGLVRDVPEIPTAHDHLQTLAWLVGEWVDESREGTVKTSCQWAEGGNYLLQDITVRQAGRPLLRISQRIGWDPLTKRFKSWTFDESGGFGEAFWTPTAAGWLIKASTTHSDGQTASATNSVEPLSFDRFVYRSVDRIVGNEVLPPVEVTVVRQGPQPKPQ